MMYNQERKRKLTLSSYLSNSFVFFSLHFILNLNCRTNWKRQIITHLEDLNSGTSSSSTSPHGGHDEGGDKQQKEDDYEVFLSFRGEDTRRGFTDHLYSSLVDAGIHVFRDDNELRVGDKIGLKLLHSITQSKISIPIISTNYASSKWCLRELVQMLECQRSGSQIVLPIYYKVEPSQVRHFTFTGRMGDAINAHKENLDEMTQWKKAIKEVSCLKGWVSEQINNGHEAAIVKMVVTKVMTHLKRHFQVNVPNQLVGIDDHVQQIISQIDANSHNTRIIGIYGMGGIGKTTLARVLYKNLSCHFEHCSFVANIRETSLRNGIECLQKHLIYDILRSQYDVSNVYEGIDFIQSRFTSKKVLVLFDDIDDYTHLDALVGDRSWFKAGSIVIITTRNKGILDKVGADHTYPLNELSSDQSLILFSKHAFRKDSPPRDYEDISCEVVSTTGGLPLSLEVIGSFLCGKKKEKVWKDLIKKLKVVPNKKVQEKLMISYEALDSCEQQIFLDIACFFIGSSQQNPTYMWDACGFFPGNGIEVLSLMSLIKIDDDGKLMMHDQLRDLGRDIVRQENQNEPQDRSRLWIYEEAVDVLDNNKGTRKIEALNLGIFGKGRGHGVERIKEANRLRFLRMESRGKSYTAEQFKDMTNLRFLQVTGANLIGDFKNLLPQLRWLQWQDCLSGFVATNFHPKKLVVLNLSRSGISEDWGGWGALKMATELKVLNLTRCESLRKTPEFSAFKHLEILILEDCVNLRKIHPSIGDIRTLVSFNVCGCRRLYELPAGLGKMEELRELLLNDTGIREIPRGWMNLEILCASRCIRLRRLLESMGFLVSLTQLHLSHTWIEKLPESIGSLKKLQTLDASFCVSLAHIPSSIGDLAALQSLLLQGCYLLGEIPNSIGKLALLTKLDLAETAIKELPESIGNLQNLKILVISATGVIKLPTSIVMLAKLKDLSVEGCENLEGLPSNIGKLVLLSNLHLRESGISSLPKSICKLSTLETLSVGYCRKLRELPELPSGLTTLFITCRSSSLPHLSQLTLLKELTLADCCWLECLPELPVGLSELSVNSCAKLKALTNLSNLKHLAVVILNRCFELTEVTGLEGLQSLSTLHVLLCPKISRLDGIKSLEFLRDLQIDDPDSSQLMRPKKSQLAGSLDLQETNAASYVNLDEIQGLGGSKSSQMLDISKYTSVRQFLDLSSSKYLRKATVTNRKNLTEIRGLDGLESLKFLDISGCMSLRQSLDLSDLKNLKVFYAANCKNLVEIQGLDGSESLRSLCISGCTSLRQSPNLTNLKNLEDFDATNCENLDEIRGLDVSKSLRDINISGCMSLRHSLDLSNLRNLNNFYAKECKNLIEIRGFDGLESLTSLNVRGCTSLRQSLALSNLKNLESFDAANCENLVEIRGLEGSKSLMYLDISGCKSLRQSLDLSNLKNLKSFNAANCENLVEIQSKPVNKSS